MAPYSYPQSQSSPSVKDQVCNPCFYSCRAQYYVLLALPSAQEVAGIKKLVESPEVNACLMISAPKKCVNDILSSLHLRRKPRSLLFGGDDLEMFDSEDYTTLTKLCLSGLYICIK